MDSNGSTCIASLFTKCDVAAIIGLVVAIYIVAFNGQIFSVAIGQRPISEWLELLPFRADRDSAGTVVFICGVGKSIAAGFHALPNTIKPVGSIRAGHAMFQTGLAKFQIMRILCFAMTGFEASAVSGSALFKVIGENMAFLAALALAKPEGSPSAFLVRADNGPTIEGLVS
jgi:hypothetical protein